MRTKYLHALWLLVLCASLAWGRCSIQARPPEPAGDVFLRCWPDDTVMAAVIPDVEDMGRHAAQHALLSAWAPRLGQALYAFIVQNMPDAALPAVPIESLHALSGALRRMALLGVAGPSAASLEWLVVAELQEQSAWLPLLFDDLIPALHATDPSLEVNISEWQGVPVYHISGEAHHVVCAIIQQRVLLAGTRATVERAIARSRADSLAETARQAASAFTSGNPADLSVTLNLPAVRTRLLAQIEHVGSQQQTTGLSVLRAALSNARWPLVEWRMRIEPDSIREDLDLRSFAQRPKPDGARADLSSPLRNHRQFVSTRLLSDRVMAYYARHINLSAWWRRAGSGAESLPGLAEWRNRLHTPLEDLFREIGDLEIGAVWYQAAQRSAPRHQPRSLARIPAVLCVHAADDADILTLRQRLTDWVGRASDRSRFQDVEVLTYQVPLFGDTFPLFHAVIDRVGLLSWSDTMLREAIRAIQYGHAAPDAQFRAWPASSATRGYLDLRSVLNRLDAERVLAGPGLPAPEAIVPFTWSTTVDSTGHHTAARSPVGGPVIGLLLLWLHEMEGLRALNLEK